MKTKRVKTKRSACAKCRVETCFRTAAGTPESSGVRWCLLCSPHTQNDPPGVSSTYHKGERTLQPATTAGAIESKQSKMANKYPHPTKENHSASQNVREGGVLVGFTRERDTEREGFSRIRYANINERKGTIDQLATNRAPAPQHIQKKSRNASRTGPIQRISQQGKEAIHMFAD